MNNRIKTAEQFQDLYDDLEAELDECITQIAVLITSGSSGPTTIYLEGKGITVGVYEPLISGFPELQKIIVDKGEVWVQLEMQQAFPIAQLYTLSFNDKREILQHMEKLLPTTKTNHDGTDS